MTTSTPEVIKLLAVMLARGMLTKGQSVDPIWSKTMVRDRYKELLR